MWIYEDGIYPGLDSHWAMLRKGDVGGRSQAIGVALMMMEYNVTQGKSSQGEGH
jgi:hypothetical protein